MKIIEVLKDEEITSVIDRIISTKDQQIILVVPNNSRALKNSVDFQLLKREIEFLRKEVRISSFDSSALSLAKKVGFETVGKTFVDQPIKKAYDIIPPDQLPSFSINDLIEPQIFEEIEGDLPTDSNFIENTEEEKEDDRFEKWSGEKILQNEKTELVTKDILPSDDKYLSEQFWRDKKYEAELTEGKRVEKENLFYDFFRKKNGEFKSEKKNNSMLSRFFSGSSNSLETDEEIDLKNISQDSIFRNKAVRFICFLIIPILLVVGYWMFLSGVTITINPLVSPLTLEFNILAGTKVPAVDGFKNEIPAQLIKIEKSLSEKFEATGQKYLESKARGTVFIYNSYSSNKQFLKVETRLLSDEGKLFKTTKGVTVPGAKIQDGEIIPSRIEVEVIADEAGEEFNILPSKFKIPGFEGSPKFKGFYGESVKAMTGGAKGNVKFVTSQDFQKAKTLMEERLLEFLKTEILKVKPKNLELLDKAFTEKILTSNAFPGVDQIGDSFEYKVEGEAAGLMLATDDIKLVLSGLLFKEIKPDQIIVESSKKLNYTVDQVNFSKDFIILKVTFSANYYNSFDKKSFKEKIIGKSEQELKEIILSDKSIDSTQLEFWPSWWKTVPSDLNKIKINVIYPK